MQERQQLNAALQDDSFKAMLRKYAEQSTSPEASKAVRRCSRAMLQHSACDYDRRKQKLKRTIGKLLKMGRRTTCLGQARSSCSPSQPL